MNRTIFLDMDGVIVDFVSAALAAVQRSDAPETISSWDMPKHLGISTAQFWDAQNAQEDFWLNLKPYPNIGLFIDTLATYGDIYFATSPSLHPNCASHKIAWLRHHVGAWTTGRFMIGKPKFLLSANRRLLIDDSDDNVNQFQMVGSGQAILFPRAWNAAGHMPESAAQISVLEAVRTWSLK
jgi:5'(3')-deoxyribonucleotidase